MPPQRSRNADWPHLFNRDVISMPDTWEYPWYAAWDLAFQMLPLARIDPEFAYLPPNATIHTNIYPVINLATNSTRMLEVS